MGNILIKNVIVHIIDNTVITPVVSDKEFEFDEFIAEYLIKQLEKAEKSIYNTIHKLDDNISKQCSFGTITKENFIDNTKIIAQELFEIMADCNDIEPADFVFILYNYNDTEKLGILKLNYKSYIIHKVDKIGGSTVNRLINYRTVLPNEKQVIEEYMLYDIKASTLKIREKSYNFNDEKKLFFTEVLLNIPPKMSDNEKFKIIDNTTKIISQEYYGSEIGKAADIRSIIKDNVDTKGEIEIDEVAKQAFINNPSMQHEYLGKLEEQGLVEKKISVNEELYKKVSKKHKMITDDGIELTFPVDYIKDSNKLEILPNEDGTVSIIIKRINTIKDK
jgi:hypothetical protein